MTKRLSDQELLNQDLRTLYPNEDLYHTLFQNGEYNAIHRILTARNHNEKEELDRLQENQKKGRVDSSLTKRYEQSAKVDRFLKDLSNFVSRLHCKPH